MTAIPFADPGALNAECRPALDRAYDRVMRSSRLILGSECAAFEREWAAYCGQRFAVGVASGFDALRLLLAAHGVGPGDEVIVPANTFIATFESVSALGAVPVPVDPDETTALLEPVGVAKALGKNTRAIVPVHLYGRQAPVDELERLASPLGIPVLVDAAQGHGLWRLGNGAAFSFYPTKNLGALGDGGAVVTNDPAIAARLRLLRHHGASERDVHDVVGGTSRLDELQAAFLRAKLQSLTMWNARRCAHAQCYDRYLPFAAGTLAAPPAVATIHHQYVIRTPRRDALRDALLAYDVETLVHYPTPPHLQPAYKPLGHGVGSFPIAEKLARESLSLPIGAELNTDMVVRAAHAVGQAVREAFQ